MLNVRTTIVFRLIFFQHSTVILFSFLFFRDDDLLSAAAWYQEGLPRQICEEFLMEINQPIGAFLLRRSYSHRRCPFVLSIRTRLSTVEHFLIEQFNDQHETYRLQVCSFHRSARQMSHFHLEHFFLGLFKML